jgi:hypothetical protein
MAINNKDDLKKQEIYPQKLYTPKIKNEKEINLNLYTPKIENKEKLSNTIDTPNINAKELDVDITTPELELYELSQDIIFPDPNNSIIKDFLIIPNPNEIDIDPSIQQPELLEKEIPPEITIPELESFSFDQLINFATKLKTPWIPSYAYAIPIKKGSSGEPEEINLDIYKVTPINFWPFTHRIGGGGGQRINDDEWYKAWKEIEDQYNRVAVRDWEKWMLSVLPRNVELPRGSDGKIKKLDWRNKRTRPPKSYFDRGPYIAYNTGDFAPSWDKEKKGVKGFFQNVTENMLSLNSKSTMIPDPNYKNKSGTIASQGWSIEAQEMRNKQFLKDMEEMWSANNWKNIGLQMAKSLGSDLLGSMMNSGSNRSAGSVENRSFNIPHIYDYYFDSQPPPGNGYSDKGFLNLNKLSSKLYGDDFKRNEVSTDYYTWLFTSKDSNPKGSTKSISRPEKFNYLNYRSSPASTHPINLMNAIGPDFMKHKFDAYLVFYKKDGTIQMLNSEEEEKWLTPFQKFIFSHKGFAVRFGNINIPKVSKTDFNVSWLQTQIKKSRTIIETENKATFTFRLDQNLFWLDMMDKIAGHNNTIDHLQYKKIKENNDETYTNIYFRDEEDYDNDWKGVIKSISQIFNSAYMDKGTDERKLCLVIKMAHLSDVIHPSTQTSVLPYFLFEDIKILGTSSNISYERESNSIQDISINFIFKFLYEVYTPNKISYDNKFEYVMNTNLFPLKDFKGWESLNSLTEGGFVWDSMYDPIKQIPTYEYIIEGNKGRWGN